MSRVLTFSRTYPSYHPKAGQPTYFVEKIWKSLTPINSPIVPYWMTHTKDLPNTNVEKSTPWDYDPKHHTIRAGNRWKPGDKFSPRVWSGQPYNSKQIIFAPDIEVKKVWDFDIIGSDFYLSGRHEYGESGGFEISQVAKNDGLSTTDFLEWFMLSPEFEKKKEFKGQIICWNSEIKY